VAQIQTRSADGQLSMRFDPSWLAPVCPTEGDPPIGFPRDLPRIDTEALETILLTILLASIFVAFTLWITHL
jgi:hypothetical protein